MNIQHVHISTDHLSNGNLSMTGEYDIPNPLNNYALTKYKAEKIVLSINPQALVIRTNFFGWGPPWRKSFSDTIIFHLRQQLDIFLYFISNSENARIQMYGNF